MYEQSPIEAIYITCVLFVLLVSQDVNNLYVYFCKDKNLPCCRVIAMLLCDKTHSTSHKL